MSLDKVASHLAAQGRGPDTTLVHMSPREVGALQTIAKQHGGSLTVNPQTGLPEAGFLDAILPVVAGAGLSLIPGVGPLMAAGIVGAGTGLLTKDLNKGLMAGLGAFGGASLAGGLMGAGTAAGAGAEGAAGALGVQGAATGPGSQAAMLAEQTAGFGPEGIESIRSAANTATGVTPTAAPTAFDQMKSGFANTKFDADYLKKNMFPIGAAAAPLLLGGGDLFGGGQKQEASNSYIRPQTYTQTRNPNYTGAGTSYFTQSMTPQTPIPASDFKGTAFAGGGIVALADGGAAAPLGIQALGPQSAGESFAPVMTYDPVSRQYISTAPAAAPAPGTFMYDAATRQYVTAPPPEAAPAGLPAIGDNQMSYMYGDSGGDVGANDMGDAANAAADAAAGVAAGEQGSPGADGNSDGPAGEGDSPGDSGDGGVGDAGFASGGITNSKMAQVEQYLAKAQSGQKGMQEVMSLAKAGDYNAAIALNKLGESPNQNYAMGGGIASLGSYSDGGRMLKGPGDGVSDSIPATIGGRQPARLAAEEFVIPARIVSELGNGSSEAGAKRLYGMMERVEHAREKSVGNGKIAVDTKAYKHLPA
jgi:hypothetical protein